MKLALAFLLILALAVFPACTQAPEAPPDSTEEEAPPATLPQEDVEAARQVVFAYREAFNNYDVEGALAFLEESYRAEREEGIRSDIGQMETYSIKLGVEEEAEPTITDDGMVAIYIKLDVPVFGQKDRHVIYYLMEIDGEWKICSHEDVG